MWCIVIYDIVSNRVRSRIAEVCMDYGLNRIQYSAFAGDLLRAHQEELMKKARHKLGRNEGKIYLFCIAEPEWARRLEVNVAPDDRQQTTDDRRQTTDDRRQMTDDR